jgi:hypothetical protein
MSESKIQIRAGILEFSGEGEQAWLSEQVDKILGILPQFLKDDTVKKTATNMPESADAQGASERIAETLDLSMQSIAAKFDGNTGPGLVTAAAAYLRFVKGRSKFSRNELLEAMKEANGYYSINHSGNLSKSLKTLISNQTLIQGADNLYSIHASKEAQLNGALK